MKIPSDGPGSASSRVRAPHERPREGNDPSKQHEIDSFYDRSPWPHRFKAIFMLVIFAAMMAFVGFIAFNLMVD